MIPVAIERNYPKRLLKAGWWHMRLFQQPLLPDLKPTLIEGKQLTRHLHANLCCQDKPVSQSIQPSHLLMN